MAAPLTISIPVSKSQPSEKTSEPQVRRPTLSRGGLRRPDTSEVVRITGHGTSDRQQAIEPAKSAELGPVEDVAERGGPQMRRRAASARVRGTACLPTSVPF